MLYENFKIDIDVHFIVGFNILYNDCDNIR